MDPWKAFLQSHKFFRMFVQVIDINKIMFGAYVITNNRIIVIIGVAFEQRLTYSYLNISGWNFIVNNILFTTHKLKHIFVSFLFAIVRWPVN